METTAAELNKRVVVICSDNEQILCRGCLDTVDEEVDYNTLHSCCRGAVDKRCKKFDFQQCKNEVTPPDRRGWNCEDRQEAELHSFLGGHCSLVWKSQTGRPISREIRGRTF